MNRKTLTIYLLLVWGLSGPTQALSLQADSLKCHMENEKWGCRSQLDNQLIIPFVYKNHAQISPHDTLFLQAEDGHWQVFSPQVQADPSRQQVPLADFIRQAGAQLPPLEPLPSTSPFQHIPAQPLQLNGYAGLLSQDQQKLLVPPVYRELGWQDLRLLKNQKGQPLLMPARNSLGRVTLVNGQGEERVPAVYADYQLHWAGDRRILLKRTDAPGWHLYDRVTGQRVLPDSLKEIQATSTGLFEVSASDGRVAWLENESLKTVVPLKYAGLGLRTWSGAELGWFMSQSWVQSPQGKLTGYQDKTGQWGLIDTHSKIVLPARFESLLLPGDAPADQEMLAAYQLAQQRQQQILLLYTSNQVIKGYLTDQLEVVSLP